MNKWSPERAEVIRQFMDEYFMENRKSPTVRDIAAGTGISKTSVERYLTDMKEHGEIEYNGRRSIGTNLSRNMFETTPAIRYDSTVSCGLPSEPNVEEADIIPLPTALVGDGKFFILTAKGDSMTGIGVDDGDLVIVREQNTCRDGDYAVVLVNASETLLKTITYLIKAYLDDEEYEKFQLFAKACKCTNSNFVRQLLVGAHLVAFPPEDYMRLHSEFLNIGININQIARIANRDGYLNVKEYEKQADLMFRMCAEMSSILLRCGAKINDDLIEASPFLTELLRKYDVEAKEARKKVDA